MAGKKITIVISQAQGKHPVRREFEEQLAMSLMLDNSVEVSLVPHLYDLSADHTGMLFLQSIPGDVIFLAWLFPRAARWTLDRQGVKGHEGISLLKAEGEDDEDLDDESAEGSAEKESQAIGALNVPNRKIYCIDLRSYEDAQVYLDEIHRIANESTVQTVDLMQWIQGNPKQEQLERYLQPTTPAEKSNGNGDANSAEISVKRRWYPVIDYSRCTNCMECIDFCLFGVYGVDHQERILVEEQDSCKKGCPACSRVCPENAIIFPGHKNTHHRRGTGGCGRFQDRPFQTLWRT